MKGVSEICGRYVPWKHSYKYDSDDKVFDRVGNLVAETVNDLDA